MFRLSTGGRRCSRRGWPSDERRSDIIGEWSKCTKRFSRRSRCCAEDDDGQGDIKNGPAQSALVNIRQVSVDSVKLLNN